MFIARYAWWVPVGDYAMKKIQTKPLYKDSNPKIDLSILCTDGKTEKYIFSTNYWRTCRDALAWYKIHFPMYTFIRATIDHEKEN